MLAVDIDCHPVAQPEDFSRGLNALLNLFGVFRAQGLFGISNGARL